MTTRRTWNQWFTQWGRRKATRRQDDFADYGTAFGLDLSLQHSDTSKAWRKDSQDAATDDAANGGSH